jgi:hypothetical protein
VSDKNPAPVKIIPAPVQENLLKNHEGDLLQRSPLRGREREDQPSADFISTLGAAAPNGAAPVEEDQPETIPLSPSERLPLQENGLAELRATWAVRPWPDADDADASKLYANACQEVGPVVIQSAAEAFVAAADAPRYLPKLSSWLARRGWEKNAAAEKTHQASRA